MARRKPWDELSPGYRRRLERAGVTAETHGQADLGLARGHSRLTLPRGRYPAPWEPTRRTIAGEATAEDRALLQRWWTGHHAPAWLETGGLEWDVAAAISAQVYSPPSTWSDVTFDPASGNMLVTFEDGSFTVVTLPRGSWPDAWEWARGQDNVYGDAMDVEVGYW